MKPFKTIDEQVEILKNRHLKFINEEAAKFNLISYGYYEIVNGYKDYLLISSNPDIFKDGSTFEHLFSLYTMDKGFQEAVVNATLEFELILKSAMSYVIAETYSSDQNKYLIKSNYKTGKVRQNKDGTKYFEIDSTFIKFNKIINDDIEPFKHYRLVHQNTPPWILFKGATLGNMMHFFKLQKRDVKDKVISIVFDIPLEIIKTDKYNIIRNLFSDLLSLAFKFRNRSAHSGRIYNYKAENTTVRYNQILHGRMKIDEALYRNNFGVNDLYTLLCGFTFLKNRLISVKLSVNLQYALNKHLELYPEDTVDLIECIGYPNYNSEDSADAIFNKIHFNKNN